MKSLNKVMLIGNVTKEPELKYTPSGTAVCTITVATNREWKDSTGQQKQEATFNRVVAWGKLGEIISQYVTKGAPIYIDGRLSNRSWKDNNGQMHYMTEVNAENMIMLGSGAGGARRTSEEEQEPPEPPKDDIDIDSLDLDNILNDGNSSLPEPPKK